MSSDDLTRVQQEVAGTVFRIDSLSPDFSKTEKYFHPGLSWKLSSPKSQISFSILSSIGNYATTLNSDVFETRNYFYVNPSASWEYDYRSGRRLMINYSSSVNTPSASQLLPVVNNMNSLSLFYGNRDLKPEYIHNARVSWWLFDQFSFTTLLASLSMQYTHDKINFVRTVDDQLRQLVSLRNFTDDWTAGSDIDFSTPIKPLGLKVSIALSENYNRGLSLINDKENVNSSLSNRISLTIDNRKKVKWDIEAGTALTITDSKYSVQNSLNNRYQDISLFTEIRYTPGVHFNIMASADITNYSAKTFDEAQLIPLIGAEASYYFMKNQRGVLTLSLVDLLNRNSGLERMSQLNYLVERRSDIIGRYIMLSFKYRLNKVGDNKGGIDIQIKKR